MKLDKDALLKHKFWILAGLSVPFAAVAILLLVTSVSSSIEGIRKTLKAALDGVKNTSNVHPELDILEQRQAADRLFKKESEAWRDAFLDQEVNFRWPRKMEATYHFADGMFANEVQIEKLPADKGQWPANKPNELIYGTLKSMTDDEFVIDAYDAETKKTSPVRFFVTPNLLNRKGAVADKEGDGNAELQYANLQDKIGKFLAVGCQRARYFNDRLTGNEQILFRKTYLSQIPPILRQVEPLRIEMAEDGKTPVVAGVVQLRSPTGWTFNPADDKDYDEILPADKRDGLIPPEGSKFLRFMAKDWNIANDVSEEAWIAQEDLWIQNEIYRVIRVANDSISDFKNVTGKATKAGDWVLFQNPYFDLSMRLKDAKTLDVKIKNRLARRQKIDGMKLRVRFVKDAKAEPEVVTISADLLESIGDPGKKDVFEKALPLKGGPKREHVFGLEQVLTWDMAAVKRIDQIAIGSLAADDTSFSHRTMTEGLRALVKVEKKEEAGDNKVGGQAPGMSGPPGGKFGGVGPVGGPGFGVPGGGGNKDAALLANGLSPERYQEVTPQFRRIPVAVALIVDQNHVDRVQTAFNNSKLRILVTQVLLNHYPQSLKPQLPDKAGENANPGGAPAQPPGFGIGPMGIGPKAGGPGFGPGPGGVPGGQFGAPAPAASVDDLEANMELVIYGIVTLYERYPPRSSQAAAPAAEKK